MWFSWWLGSIGGDALLRSDDGSSRKSPPQLMRTFSLRRTGARWAPTGSTHDRYRLRGFCQGTASGAAVLYAYGGADSKRGEAAIRCGCPRAAGI